MSDTGRWILYAVSVVVLVAGMSAYIYTLRKVRRLKREYKKSQLQFMHNMNGQELGDVQKVLTRQDHGELLWDFLNVELEKSVPLLPLNGIELSINTIIRNNYKSVLVFNDTDGFTAINLAKKTSQIVHVSGKIDWEQIQKNNALYKANVERQVADQKYDYIVIQDNYPQALENAFENAFANLLNKGGLVFIDTTHRSGKDKQKSKEVSQQLRFKKYRFENLGFDKNFFLVAK